MCTATWLREKDGYEIFFNRDEKRTRLPALPPAILERNGIRFIAPADGNYGGTWVAVNEVGITSCLLNGGYGAARTATQSRGLLPLSIAAMSSFDAIRRYLESETFERWAPFAALVLDPSERTLICRWDGEWRAIEPVHGRIGMLTSSSFDTDWVGRYRREEFDHLPHSAAALREFHRSHRAPSKAHSVCMHRPDAKTVSFSYVNVGRGAAEFRYRSGSPCQNQPEITLELRRRS